MEMSLYSNNLSVICVTVSSVDTSFYPPSEYIIVPSPFPIHLPSNMDVL
jgi:hypothetical protein